ncbi:54S ribosomal protein L17 mitochondrial [Chamberlinius hualienensis]
MYRKMYEIPDSYHYGRLIPKLKVRVRPEQRKLSQPEGALGRLHLLSRTVTALLKFERIELNFHRGHEARGYAERLITEALRYGDRHKPTMELADFWIREKQVIHKLFKVLVPRYNDYQTSYTRLHRAPDKHPQKAWGRVVLELKGNPFPPVVPITVPVHFQIQNILLREAKKEFGRDNFNTLPYVEEEEEEESESNLNRKSLTDDEEIIKISEKLKSLPIDEKK